MQNIFKRILSCGMALLMCLGITTVVHSTVTESYSYVADAATDYYAKITATKGTDLLGQLHDLITETHTTYSSYADCKDPATVIKTDPGTANNTIRDFYTQEDVPSKWDGNSAGSWNREHVWCQSLSNDMWDDVSNSTRNGGTDLHHIRPAEVRLNGTRGNKTFGEANGGTPAYYKDSNGSNKYVGGYVSGNTFEPLDKVKGDVARIVMYVYTHYNTYSNVGGTKDGGSQSGVFGTLNLTKIMSASTEAAAKKLLLEWNKLDPVDDIERTRNDAVFAEQGNRNPFIDNETYADAIWGSGTATEIPVDPSVQITSLTVNPSSLNLTVGQTQKLTATVTPSNANSSVKWNSDNPLIASVSADGVVTAKAEGTAKIYATSTSDSTKKDFATVTVAKSSGGSTTPVTPTVGGSITIDARSFLINGDGYGFYQWAIEEPDVAGIACIYGAGATTGQNPFLQFSTTNKNAKGHYLASTKATPGAITSVTVKLNSNTSAGKDSWKLLTSTIPYKEVDGKPTDGTDHDAKQVTLGGTTWTVSGNDTYFALTYEGTGASYLDSIVVEYGGSSQGTDPVTPPAVELEGIEIVPSTVALSVGQTKELTVLPDPLNATVNVNWTTSNSSVATVSADGVVTAKGAGTATITATDKNNTSINSTATVTVSEGEVTPSDTVTVTLSSFTLSEGYGFKEWSEGGFGGIGYIFGGDSRYPDNAPTNIQLSQKKDSCYIASNVSAGGIKSITIKNGNPNNYSAKWTLLTSNTPYGEVAGIPGTETGTNNDAKTVAQGESVTWTLDGSEKYFALTVEPDAKGYAVYLDSIIIEYEGNGQGAYVPDIDKAKLASFHEAVAAIATEETDLEVYDAKIKAAEAILATLTTDEKVEAIDDINALAMVKILYDIAVSEGDNEVDNEKIDDFKEAVTEIYLFDENVTIEEREAKISAAEEILDTMNVEEKMEVLEEIVILNEARAKLDQDKKKAEEAENPPVPPVNQKLVAFHNAVESIKSDGTIEEREAQIAAADEIYATLTANEKAEALEDIEALTAAKAKLEQDKNGSGGEDDDPVVDQKKLADFHNAVEAIPANGTLDERFEAIEAAFGILQDLNEAELEAAADDVDAFYEAYKKYLEDADGDEPITPTPSENVKTFKSYVAAIPSKGTLEVKFNALKNAIAAYQKLTAAEKETVSEEIEALNAAIAGYNDTVSSYNSSSETSSDIAVSGLKSFL